MNKLLLKTRTHLTRLGTSRLQVMNAIVIRDGQDDIVR